jgi:hypothetical protein
MDGPANITSRLGWAVLRRVLSWPDCHSDSRSCDLQRQPKCTVRIWGSHASGCVEYGFMGGDVKLCGSTSVYELCCATHRNTLRYNTKYSPLTIKFPCGDYRRVHRKVSAVYRLLISPDFACHASIVFYTWEPFDLIMVYLVMLSEQNTKAMKMKNLKGYWRRRQFNFRF